MPPASDGIFYWQNLVLLALAGLVSNTAAGLASGLARSLALAAAALDCALAQVTGFQSLNSFHNSTLQSKFLDAYTPCFLHFTTEAGFLSSINR